MVDSIATTDGHANLPLQVSEFREKYKKFIQNLSRHKRTPASHVFVIMISPEERSSKPYMQYQYSVYPNRFPKLVDKVILQMKSRGMKVAGKLYSIIAFICVVYRIYQ